MKHVQKKRSIWPALVERLVVLSNPCWAIVVGCLLLVVHPIFFVAGTLLAVFGLLPKRKYVSDTHGTAEWCDVQELSQSGCLDETGIPLGQTLNCDPAPRSFAYNALLTFPLRKSAEAVSIATYRYRRSRPLRVYLPDRFPHVATFGASGGFKTSAYALPYLLSDKINESCFVTDSKGELARLSAEFRHKVLGHEIVLIDPFNCAAGCGFKPAGFNPLDMYRGNETMVVDEARRIAGSLVTTTGLEHDQFWPTFARTVITATLAFLMTDGGENSSLNQMREIISNPDIMQKMIDHMLQSKACSGLLTRLAGQLLQCQGQTRASAYSVANSHIDFLDSLPLANCLAQSTFDPRRMLTNKMTVYLCLPVDRTFELAGIQRVILSSFINMVFGAGEDPSRRIRFVLDEAATLGKLDALYNAVQFGRSYGLRMMFLFQSASQVTRCFHSDSQKDDFFGTVASVYAATNDLASAKIISECLGQKTVLTRSTQSGGNWGAGSTYGTGQYSQSTNWGGNSSTSYSEVGRALLRPEEILALPRQCSIVMLPGQQPMLTQKRPYFLESLRQSKIVTVARMIVHLLILFGAVSLAAISVWAMTIGYNHPEVIDFRRHMEMQIRPAQFNHPQPTRDYRPYPYQMDPDPYQQPEPESPRSRSRRGRSRN